MSRELKVGVFVVLGLALTMVTIFVIGDTKRLWEAKISYSAAFDDVAGLKPGAPVRMGGFDIGAVTHVGHDRSANDAHIYVKMVIVKAEAGRIRADTMARIVGKGLLGDKMVELTPGSGTAAALPADSQIPSEDPTDVFSAANRVAEATQKAVENIEPLAQALGDPKFASDIKGTVADIHSLLEALVHSDSTVHRLLYDHREAEQVDELLANMSRTTSRIDAVLADVEDVTAHVKQGPGIAHALIYDGDISQNASGSIAELHADLKAVREGNGIAHAVLYGDSSSQHVMSNLNAMSDDLRVIVGNMREGKGTLGALLVDPTVYEDIKGVVGNVERNEVLRALVRYSIKADEKK
jgi:phospholipid/cholesterol/gamma-HCH transport system substrate-binding protein